MDGYGDISDEEKIRQFEINKNANPDSAEARAYKTAEAAMLNYYSYILAFQMAAAVQGMETVEQYLIKTLDYFKTLLVTLFLDQEEII